MTVLSTDHINVDLKYVGNILCPSVWEYCKIKYHLAFCQIIFVWVLFLLCHCNTITQATKNIGDDQESPSPLYRVSVPPPYFFWYIRPVSLTTLWIHSRMLLESLTLMCFYRIRTEGSAAPHSLYLCTSSGKLAAGLVPVHSSASLLSRICGPAVQNDLLCLWGPQASGGVACCFSSIYSVGSSALHLPWEAFACPPHVQAG